MGLEISRRLVNGVWETVAEEEGAGGPISLDDLTDVDLAGGSDGDVLTQQLDGSYAPKAPTGGSSPGWTGPFTIYALKWQTIDLTGDQPDAGTFKLSYDGDESDAINWNAAPSEVVTALEAIPALTGKVTTDDDDLNPLPANAVHLIFDDSLSPFVLLTVSNNSLTNSAVPVANPAVYVAANAPKVPLFTPQDGDILEDFLISVPATGVGFGSGSNIYFSPESGDDDWPQGMGLLIDSTDNSENWGGSSSGDANAFRSVALAVAASMGGSYNTVPCPIYHASEISANLDFQGQGTDPASVNVWVKTASVQAPS